MTDRADASTPDSVDRHVALWSRELDWMDPVKEAIFARLAVLARHADRARRDTLLSGGLQRGQFKILLMLRRLGPPYEASPSQLADMLGLTRGALSARLGPIEDAGLITRSAGTADRRRVRVRLTAAGYEAFERHAASEDEGENALLAVLSPAERQTLAGLLRKLVVAAETGSDGISPSPYRPRRSRSDGT
ncbi:MarR family transcriptional regulator [Streptomyces sp. NBC_00638]|uniref:MarR family winged helix-turn-helix transcriptional regulator n=1 Tax=unclassified Streptomyces TaxID=2593676 RepID=UPI00224D23E3|nr:MarR family transcriptional regulator [Streptomyces sp. NBC_00638]MCX5007951.1 MarR family transcriptional regulator [Streptomyces sp. NBC_00638]